MEKAVFKGTAELTLGQTSAPGKGRLEQVGVYLDLSDNLVLKQYKNPDGTLTPAGVKALSQTFLQGLIGNIHAAHQRGQWDSAEHLRWAISQMEEMFVQIVEVTQTDRP